MAFFIASFVAGDTRVLAATVKLGMGYDKSDIRFVIHFQLPQNLIAYYQQIGRAGRDGKPAYAFLLHGEEDEEILTHFIATAQASPNLLKDIVGMARSGVRYGEMLKALNVKGCSYSSVKRDSSSRWAFLAMLTQALPGLRSPPAVTLRTEPCPS